MVRVLTGVWSGSGLRRRDRGAVAAPGRGMRGGVLVAARGREPRAGPPQRLVALASVRESVKPLPETWLQHSMPDSEEVQAKEPFLALAP